MREILPLRDVTLQGSEIGWRRLTMTQSMMILNTIQLKIYYYQAFCRPLSYAMLQNEFFCLVCASV